MCHSLLSLTGFLTVTLQTVTSTKEDIIQLDTVFIHSHITQTNKLPLMLLRHCVRNLVKLTVTTAADTRTQLEKLGFSAYFSLEVNSRSKQTNSACLSLLVNSSRSGFILLAN